MPIPWGDVASAFYTTGIPNITVFAPTSLTTLAVARLTNAFQLVLRSSLVQSWLVEKIEKNLKGPDAATRNASQTWVWGEARDARGRQHEIRSGFLFAPLTVPGSGKAKGAGHRRVPATTLS